MALRLASTRSVCGPMPPCTISPDAGSSAICPAVNRNPSAITACEYGPMARGARSVDTCFKLTRELLEEADDRSVGVNRHAFGGGLLRQSRHRHDVACLGDDESRAGGCVHFVDRDPESGWTAESRRIIGERILRLRH